MGLELFPPSAGGIPTGNTADRPANPVIGDVYYNGELGYLEIYDGNDWIPSSAPADAPTISVVDVGTGIAFGAAQGVVTFTEGPQGGPTDSFIVSSSTGGYSASTNETTLTITVGNSGSYTFSGKGVNTFGESAPGPTVTETLTTVPAAPVIGTATTSAVTSDVTVTWTLGSNGGKNLSAITITPFLDGTTAQTSQIAATTSSTSHAFTGLTQNSSYTFKVKATNANGDSLESSATNSITVPISIDYLVVAGGGGGGVNNGGGGGGGGAGGLRSTVTATGGGGSLEGPLSVNLSTNYTVTVGAGGTAATFFGSQPGVGGISVFNTITSSGGGGGGSVKYQGWIAPTPGGSGGGGGASNAATGAAGTANQGFAGGNNTGGGGGAGEAGNTDGAGEGGDGVAVSITGSSVTYAGGGGGQGSGGGDGGGGSGGTGGLGNTGTVNTGGGGGGSVVGGTGAAGVTGGSGVVVLRWLTSAASITVGAGLTADSTGTDGSYSYKRFTAGTGNVSFS